MRLPWSGILWCPAGCPVHISAAGKTGRNSQTTKSRHCQLLTKLLWGGGEPVLRGAVYVWLCECYVCVCVWKTEREKQRKRESKRTGEQGRHGADMTTRQTLKNNSLQVSGMGLTWMRKHCRDEEHDQEIKPQPQQPLLARFHFQIFPSICIAQALKPRHD